MGTHCLTLARLLQAGVGCTSTLRQHAHPLPVTRSCLSRMQTAPLLSAPPPSRNAVANTAGARTRRSCSGLPPLSVPPLLLCCCRHASKPGGQPPPPQSEITLPLSPRARAGTHRCFPQPPSPGTSSVALSSLRFSSGVCQSESHQPPAYPSCLAAHTPAPTGLPTSLLLWLLPETPDAQMLS